MRAVYNHDQSIIKFKINKLCSDPSHIDYFGDRVGQQRRSEEMPSELEAIVRQYNAAGFTNTTMIVMFQQ